MKFQKVKSPAFEKGKKQLKKPFFPPNLSFFPVLVDEPKNREKGGKTLKRP
jgi:hypothetical protein